MKIVLIGPTYPFRGGVSHYTTLLCKELKKKHQIKFLSFSRPYPNWLFPGESIIDKSKKPIKEKGVERTIDWANPLSWVATAFKIKNFNPELVIFTWYIWGWSIPFAVIILIIKVFTNIKILFICHNVIEHEPTWWKNYLTKIVLPTSNYYIVHSKSDYKKLKNIVPKAQIKITFHPTYRIFKLKDIKKYTAKKKLNLNGRVILFFGHVRPYKGLIYLLQALPIVLKELDVTLIVAGEFWEDKKKYQNLIKRLNIAKHVKIFDQYIPNEKVALYFSAADFVVMPYISASGTGIAQLALGLGKAVVGTNVGDLPEVIENGRRGLIVKPKSSKELANAIIRMYQENLIQKFSQNIKKDKDLFSWSNLITIIESFNI